MGGVYKGLLAHAGANSLVTANFPEKAYVDLIQNGQPKITRGDRAAGLSNITALRHPR